jgi:hypothetical protein
VADGKCYIDFILLVWTIFFFREQVRACVSLRGKIIIISHTNLAHTRKLKQEKQEKQQQQPPRLAWKPIESKLPTPTPAGDPTSLNNLQRHTGDLPRRWTLRASPPETWCWKHAGSYPSKGTMPPAAQECRNHVADPCAPVCDAATTIGL